MEITSFVLGMLTIVAVLIVTAIVAGMVKIYKLETETRKLREICVDIETNFGREIEATHRNIQRLDDERSWELDEFKKNVDLRFDETTRYIDSRIDKALGTMGAKQVING
jgi:hypothetical protein